MLSLGQGIPGGPTVPTRPPSADAAPSRGDGWECCLTASSVCCLPPSVCSSPRPFAVLACLRLCRAKRWGWGRGCAAGWDLQVGAVGMAAWDGWAWSRFAPSDFCRHQCIIDGSAQLWPRCTDPAARGWGCTCGEFAPGASHLWFGMMRLRRVRVGYSLCPSGRAPGAQEPQGPTNGAAPPLLARLISGVFIRRSGLVSFKPNCCAREMTNPSAGKSLSRRRRGSRPRAIIALQMNEPPAGRISAVRGAVGELLPQHPAVGLRRGAG